MNSYMTKHCKIYFGRNTVRFVCEIKACDSRKTDRIKIKDEIVIDNIIVFARLTVAVDNAVREVNPIAQFPTETR